MKSTLITFVTTLLMTFALSACTQDQGETGGMGQTGDSSATGGTSQGGQDDIRMSDDRSVDLPQESPAAGDPGAPGSTTSSPDSGVQSPDATTGSGTGPGVESRTPGAAGGAPESGTTSSPGTTGAPGSTPEVEATPPSEAEQDAQQQDEPPRNY